MKNLIDKLYSKKILLSKLKPYEEGFNDGIEVAVKIINLASNERDAINNLRSYLEIAYDNRDSGFRSAILKAMSMLSSQDKKLN